MKLLQHSLQSIMAMEGIGLHPNNDRFGLEDWNGLQKHTIEIWYILFNLAAVAALPVVLLFYVTGIAAVAREQYDNFAALLTQTKVRNPVVNDSQPGALALIPFEVLNRKQARKVLNKPGRHTPLNDHLFEILRLPLRELVPSDEDYSRVFDLFEYLLTLVYADLKFSR